MSRLVVSRTRQILSSLQQKNKPGLSTMARQTHSQPPIATNIDSGGRARVTWPGWGRNDLDDKGRFRLWQGMSLFEYSSDFLFDRGYLEIKELEKTHLTYSRCVDACVSEKMARLHQSGQHAYAYPIHVDFSVSHIGRTSFCMLREVRNQSEESLLTSSMTYVTVDVNTKKPSSPAEWWSERYSHLKKEGSKPLIVQSFQPPDKIDYLYKMTACPTDLDYYGHVNNTSYHRFCVNAAMTAAYKGMLGKIEPHMIDSQVKGLKGAFIRDSNQGDDLFIKVWRNPEDKAVFSLVTNADGGDVYQETMYL